MSATLPQSSVESGHGRGAASVADQEPVVGHHTVPSGVHVGQPGAHLLVDDHRPP